MGGAVDQAPSVDSDICWSISACGSEGEGGALYCRFGDMGRKDGEKKKLGEERGKKRRSISPEFPNNTKDDGPGDAAKGCGRRRGF